jgi:hypothetical protein
MYIMALALVTVVSDATAQSWGTSGSASATRVIRHGQVTGASDAGVRPFSDPLFAALTNVQPNQTSADDNNTHDYGLFSPMFERGQLTGTWGADGREAEPPTVLDPEPGAGLLNFHNGADGDGAWKLFLTDMDFGSPGNSAQWGVVISAIPEPSTCGLLCLGGLLLGIHFRRQRRSL